MNYHTLRMMIKGVREAARFFRRSTPNYTIDGITNAIMSWLVYTYFWNYETDMPTCDYDQLETVVRSTVRKNLLENF